MTFKVRYADNNADAEEWFEDESRGGGAQGDIYYPAESNRAAYYPDGQPRYVVKLYKETARATGYDFHDRTAKLISRKYNPTADDPYWKDFFAWPERHVIAPREGFRMAWAHSMRRLDDYMYNFPGYWEDLKPQERGWFIGRLVVALKLAMAADRLARMGLCYADFSHRNAMADIYEGRMMLIDCDALTVPNVIPPEVEGSGYYRAPEIISRDERTPSIKTDRHSLAVLFYSWFLGPHPLEGSRPPLDLNPSEDDKLRFGRKALYIEDPKDSSNRRATQILKTDMLGEEIADLFKRAFVDGLHAPDKRPQPRLWAEAFWHAYDRVIPCASTKCDWRFFVAKPQQALTCPRCGTQVTGIKSLLRLYIQPKDTSPNPEGFEEHVINQHWVVGWPGRNLHDWHLKRETPIHADHEPNRTPRATFEYDAGEDIWFLKNLGTPNMRFQQANSNIWETWAPNLSLQLHEGMRLQFGDAPYSRALVKVEEL